MYYTFVIILILKFEYVKITTVIVKRGVEQFGSSSGS